MKRLLSILPFVFFFLPACYTVLEFAPLPERASSYTYQSEQPDYSEALDTVFSKGDYAQGFQDGFTEYARFRDEQRWLRWNQWQYWGSFNDPLFWSYNDMYWNSSFYWSTATPFWAWNMGWNNPGWGIGLGGWGNGWGWGGGWNAPIIIINDTGSLAGKTVRGPRGSGRRDITNAAVHSEAARSNTRPSLDPIIMSSGGTSSGKAGNSGGRKARSSSNGSENGNAVRTSASTTRSSSGTRGSGRSDVKPTPPPASSSGSGSDSGGGSSGGSGRKPRGS